MLKSVVRTMNQWRTRITAYQESLTINDHQESLKLRILAEEARETALLLNEPARRIFWGQKALEAMDAGRHDQANIFSSHIIT